MSRSSQELHLADYAPYMYKDTKFHEFQFYLLNVLIEPHNHRISDSVWVPSVGANGYRPHGINKLTY